MRRDMGLIRRILMAVEAWPPGYHAEEIEIEERDPIEVTDHVMLAVEAGLLEAINVSSLDSRAFLVQRLTWDGHDFLDAARDESVWKDAMARIGKVGGSVTLDVMKALLSSIVHERLKL